MFQNFLISSFILSTLLFLIGCGTAGAEAPVFEKDPTVFNTVENVILKVRCSASGDPEPNYNWYNEAGDELGPLSKPPVQMDSGRSGNITFSDLIFNVTEAAHTGVYTCAAKNEHGLRSKVYNITIDGRPDEERLEIVNATSTSATFRLHFIGNKTLDIRYSEKIKDYTLYKTHSGGEYIAFENLIPSGSYRFRFSLRRETKTWNATLVLLPSQPEVIFHQLADGMLRIEWFRTVDDSLRNTIDKYRLQYLSVQQMRGSYWERNSCNVTIDIPACIGSRFTLAHLEKRIYYEIVLSAHTSAGYGTPFKNKIYIN